VERPVPYDLIVPLYIAAGTDGVDLITGRYDLDRCLRLDEPLVVPRHANTQSRPLGSLCPANSMRAYQQSPPISREHWPFRLFRVEADGDADQVPGSVRLSGGRVAGEEARDLLFGQLGREVATLVTDTISNWDDIEARLSAARPERRETFHSLSEYRSIVERIRAGEHPNDAFSSSAELGAGRLSGLAKRSDRMNLFALGMVFWA
jgi:hypothetical protein